MATKAITYLQAEGDVEACFAARGAHNLFLEGEAQRYAILGSIAGVSLVDGIKELEWPCRRSLSGVAAASARPGDVPNGANGQIKVL